MKRLARWTMRLYPARWRRRYGDELDALLADTGADARVIANLFGGGIRMQFSTWSFARLAVVLGIGGLILGTAASFLIPNVYVSTARVQVLDGADFLSRAEPVVLSRTVLSGIINDPHLLLYKEDLKVTPLENVIEEMRRSIEITPVTMPGLTGTATTFDISFQYPDRAVAQQTVGQLIEKFRFYADSHEAQQTSGRPNLDVVDTANVPIWPVSPDRHVVWWTVAAFFVLIAVAWRRLRRKPLATWGFAVSAVAMCLLGLIAGSALAIQDQITHTLSWIGNQYRSTATMSAENMTPEQLQSLFSQALSRTSLSTVIQDPRLGLYQDELKSQPLEDSIARMRRHLSIAPSGSPHYFNVSFEYGDRYKAQQTVTMIVNRLGEFAGQGVTTGPLAFGAFAVLDAPSQPQAPVKPNRLAIAGISGLAGLLLAAVIAAARNRWKPMEEIPLDPADA